MGVIFEKDYAVCRAAIIPHSLVLSNARFSAHSRGWIFQLNDDTWAWKGVKDVTDQLRAVTL